eukprot:m.81257 g.81257  ORF g.81257 m.81257 type:complete len:459 (-) comp12051_c0_seq9:826-2202(-)
MSHKDMIVFLAVAICSLWGINGTLAQYPLGCDQQPCNDWCVEQGEPTVTEVQNVDQLMCCCGYAKRNRDDLYVCNGGVECPSHLTHYITPTTTTTTMTTLTTTTTTQTTTSSSSSRTTPSSSSSTTSSTTSSSSSSISSSSSSPTCEIMENRSQYDATNVVLFRHNTNPGISFPIQYKGGITNQRACSGDENKLWYALTVPFCGLGSSQVSIHIHDTTFHPSAPSFGEEGIFTLAVLGDNNQVLIDTTSLRSPMEESRAPSEHIFSFNNATFSIANTVTDITFAIGVEGQHAASNALPALDGADFSFSANVFCHASSINDESEDDGDREQPTITTTEDQESNNTAKLWIWPLIVAVCLLLFISVGVLIRHSRRHEVIQMRNFDRSHSDSLLEGIASANDDSKGNNSNCIDGTLNFVSARSSFAENDQVISTDYPIIFTPDKSPTSQSMRDDDFVVGEE